MPLQLWETTMDPESRLLKQLTVEDAAEANIVFSSLMGTRVMCTISILFGLVFTRIGLILYTLVHAKFLATLSMIG